MSPYKIIPIFLKNQVLYNKLLYVFLSSKLNCCMYYNVMNLVLTAIFSLNSILPMLFLNINPDSVHIYPCTLIADLRYCLRVHLSCLQVM